MPAETFFKKHFRSILLLCLLLILFTLVFFFWNEIFNIGTIILGQGDESTVRNYIQSKDTLFMLLFVFIQAVLVLITVLPSELFQVFTGIAYNFWLGVLICWAGVLSGSLFVFIFARHTKATFISERTKKQQTQLSEQFKKTNRHHIVLIILMYLLPGFTYGMISLIAATCTNLKWWQYLIITAMGAFFFIPLTVFFGNMIVTANPLSAIITACCIIVFVFIIMMNKNRLISFIFKQKKTLDEKLNTFKTRKPSEWLYSLIIPFYRRNYIKSKNVQFIYKYDVKSLKPPFLVLSSHPSRWDYAYVIFSMFPYKMNIIINRWYFQNRLLYPLLRLIGGIPKKLFSAELNPMKNIMNVIKNKGIIKLFPEGINTIYGASNPVIPAIAGLIKKLKIPVVSVQINGAFLTMPKWNYEAKHTGIVETNVDLLFTPEQIEQKTSEELLSDLNNKLAYNDYKWARENKIVFKAENRTRGLNHLLYICPNCKSQFKMAAEDNKIWCTECGNGAFLDNSFQLNKIKDTDSLPLDIAEWFKIQESILSGEVILEDFEIQEECTVKTFDKNGYKLYTKYEGYAVINKYGLRFTGKDIKTTEQVNFFCERAKLPMISNTLNKSFDFYLNNNYYEFILKDGIKAVKCSMAIHEIYKQFEGKE